MIPIDWSLIGLAIGAIAGSWFYWAFFHKPKLMKIRAEYTRAVKLFLSAGAPITPSCERFDNLVLIHQTSLMKGCDALNFDKFRVGGYILRTIILPSKNVRELFDSFSDFKSSALSDVVSYACATKEGSAKLIELFEEEYQKIDGSSERLRDFVWKIKLPVFREAELYPYFYSRINENKVVS